MPIDLARSPRRGLAPELLQHLALHAEHLVHRLDHVHGDADRARLVGDRAGDRLADPPRRVRRELEALRVVELLDRADQAEVALLDQVEQAHAAPDVALGDRHDEAEVGLDQLAAWRARRRARRAGRNRSAQARFSAGSSSRSCRARSPRPCRRRSSWWSRISQTFSTMNFNALGSGLPSSAV